MPRSTPWTGITDNKIITHQDIKQAADDGYFDQLQTITLDLSQCITKNRVIQHFDVDQDNLESRINNQLVTKVKARRPKQQCVSYHIKVEQTDLNLSDDGKVYVYYYPCGETGGTASFTTYSYSGTFLSDVCVQNYPNLDPYLQIFYDGGVPNTNIDSRLILLPGQCTQNKIQVVSMSGCTSNSGLTNTFTYQITKPGITKLNTYFELDKNYGNIDVRISGTTNNTSNEIFIGNYTEKIGETFSLSSGILTDVTGSLGYFSRNNSKNLDITVHSTNSTTFQPFTLSFTCGCTSTIKCSSIVPGETESYVQNVVLNVTNSGILIYNNSKGEQITKYVKTGNITLSECIILESLKNTPITGTNPQEYSSPLILSDPTEYIITSTGTTCTSSTTGITSNYGDNVEIIFEARYGFSAMAYWVDCSGNQRSRFVNVNETFTICGKFNSGTGVPVYYGSPCSCYEP